MDATRIAERFWIVRIDNEFLFLDYSTYSYQTTKDKTRIQLFPTKEKAKEAAKIVSDAWKLKRTLKVQVLPVELREVQLNE